MRSYLRGFIFGVGVALLLFATSPLQAQGAAASGGDITPAGLLVAAAGIAVAVVGGTFALTSRYLDYRLKTAEAIREKHNQEDAATRQKEQETVQNFGELINGIVVLGKGMSDSSAMAALDRQQAALERREMKVTLDRNTDELGKHAQELAQLRTLMEHSEENSVAMLDLIRAIQKRIGGSENDPPLTKLLNEAAEAAKKAADALTQAQQAVTPQSALADVPAPPSA